MHTDMSHNANFKRRIAAGELLLGAFIKTPHPMIIEIMGESAFDFLILDCEHAPFDRGAIDTAMIAGRATGCPLLVRVPHGDAATILGILDAGAAGVMVPHVTSAAQAEALVRAMRYGVGGRGFAGTTRAAHYGGRTLKQHLAATADDVSLFCQIEEPEGVENAEAIAAVDGVDALFVGRADLAVAYGEEDFFAPKAAEGTRRSLGVKGAATGLYCPPSEDVAPWREAGASILVIGSEHTLMTTGAAQIAARLRPAA